MNLTYPGYAIGGLAVGESHDKMYETIENVVPYLPKNKPTYLMGVGTPANILEAVDRGVDFFDCVLPANGRHANVYTNKGKLNYLMLSMSLMTHRLTMNDIVLLAKGIVKHTLDTCLKLRKCLQCDFVLFIIFISLII